MAPPKEKFWIVLVNRVPQGPYTEEQLKALLNANKFSRNEVGMLVSPDGNERLSDWKILWQFEEFDRRRKKKGDASQPAPKVERRKTLTEPEIAKVKQEKLPPNMIEEISAEDLVPKKAESKGTSTNLEAISNEAIKQASADIDSDFSLAWVPKALMGIAAIFVVVVGAQWMGGWVDDQPSVGKNAVKRTLPNRRPATPKARSNKGRTPLSGITPKPQQLPQRSAPLPERDEPIRDFGQVPETVFDDMEADAEKLRRKLNSESRRNRRRRQDIRPLPAGEELDEYPEDEEYDEDIDDEAYGGEDSYPEPEEGY